MPTSIITCSIPIELAEFLKDNPEISPSKVLQQKLFAIKDEEERLKEKVKGYEVRLVTAARRLEKILNFVSDNGLTIPKDVLE